MTNIVLVQNIYANNQLEYVQCTERPNKRSGELFHIEIRIYKNLFFIFNLDSLKEPKTLKVSGSLHYFYNGGIHNANDFTYLEFVKTLQDLKNTFSFNYEKCKLLSFEYGINIVPLHYKTDNILQNIFHHKRKKFFDPTSKSFRQCGTPKDSRMVLKCYNKKNQFQKFVSSTELLRFELKYCRMRDMNQRGIVFLSDLISQKIHRVLQTELIKRFEEVLMYDFTINEKELSTSFKKNVSNYKNSIYWNKLASPKDSGRNLYTYHVKNLKKIIKLHSEQVQNKLLTEIRNKLNVLMPI